MNMIINGKITVATAFSLLALHNFASILLQHRVQSQPKEDHDKHDALIVILVSEVIKLSFFTLFAMIQHTPLSDLASPSAGLQRSIWNTLASGHKDAILPAVLYTFATYLQSIGAYHLDLLRYLMLSQAKVITPVLGVILLNQRFTRAQWLCFILASLGVILVQSAPTKNMTLAPSAFTRPRTPMLGAGCMLVSGFCVAPAGVLMEKMLQTSKMFMVRNAQLAWYSFVSATLFYLCRSRSGRSPVDVFHGFSLLVWSFTLLQATGGLIVAWCVALTSTVVKNHAQVVGFMLASMEPLVSQRHINIQHLCGVVISVGALFEYAWQRSKINKTVHKHFSKKEDTMV